MIRLLNAFFVSLFCATALGDTSLIGTLAKVQLVLNESDHSLCPTGKLDLSQGFRLYSENGFPGTHFDISFSLVNWEVQGDENPLLQEYPAPAYNPMGKDVRKACVTRSIASYVNENSDNLSVLSQGLYMCSDRSTLPVTSTLFISKKGNVVEVEVTKTNGPSQVTCKYSAAIP